MGIVHVNGIRAYAYHGCMDEEKAIGQEYQVDIRVYTDFGKSVQSDQLDDTVDYVDVHNIVRREMAVRSKLIEHVAWRIGTGIKAEIKSVDHVWVKVTKFNPPIGGQSDSVAVELEV